MANPEDCFAVILFKEEDLSGKTRYDYEAEITVGQQYDNINVYGHGKEIDWKPGKYFVVMKSLDAKNNVSYSFHYDFTIG